jgi:peptide/nickel transport system substrate-binding protein
MHVDTAQVIANQLERSGIQTTIRLVDWTTWLADVYRARNYQATVISIDSPVVSPRSFLARYHSANGNNFMNFANNDFDTVFDSLLTETDEQKRNELYREAQRIITANAAGVFIQDILYYMVFRKGIFDGFKNYPLYTIDFSAIYRIDFPRQL